MCSRNRPLISKKKKCKLHNDYPLAPGKIGTKREILSKYQKIILAFNNSAYIGMCILDLSKVLMCEFHYDYIQNKYVNNSDYFIQTPTV